MKHKLKHKQLLSAVYLNYVILTKHLEHNTYKKLNSIAYCL